MNKPTPLEALWRLYQYPNLADRNVVAYLLEQDNLATYHSIVKKALEALEIIKEKRVDVSFFDTYIKWNWEKYQNRKLKCSDIELTQEEFDLLKEVLK